MLSKSDRLIFLSVLILFLLCWGAYLAYLLSGNQYDNSSDNSTLKLVHVLIRHGDRHPDKVSVCPSSPYYDEKYYPEGYGQLTNAGKRREYQVGAYLRNRYNDFLGQTWNIKHLEARSSDYNRTKMSLQLVLAGLYPPTGLAMWSSISWQPIPYNYVPKYQDKEILPYYACTRYLELANQLYEEPGIKQYLQRYEEIFQILGAKCKRKMDVTEAFNLFVGFKIQEELGFPLEEWTKSVYPEPLHSGVIDMYYLMTNTTEIRRIITGYFLKKLLADTEAKINGTLFPKERKLFIYAAHEMNVAVTLIALGMKISEIPPYGSYIIFEIHQIEGVHGFKIFYQNYKQNEPLPLKIHGCDYFCRYDDFYRLMEEYLPNDDTECFGNSVT